MPKIDLIELHMAAAHFPIALLMSSAFFGILGHIKRKPEFETTSFWIHMLGIVGAAVTLALGVLANPFREDIGWVGRPFGSYESVMAGKAAQHAWAGIASVAIFVTLGLWRLKRRTEAGGISAVTYWSLTLIGVVVLGMAGYLGAHIMD